jgi:membrane-associated phospholipid phosphatase
MKTIFTLLIFIVGINGLYGQLLPIAENSNDMISVATFSKVSQNVDLGTSDIKLSILEEAIANLKPGNSQEYSNVFSAGKIREKFAESYGTAGQDQSPYKVNWPVYGGIAGLSGLFYFLSPESEPLTQQELDALNKEDINRLDRGVTGYHSPSLAKQSDVFLYGSFLLGGIVPLAYPALAKSDNKVIVESAKVFGMYAGSFLLCYTGTRIVKNTVLRTRPYVYNPESTYDKHEVDARYSFFSGHSSHTAFNTFFAAKVFSDYFPDSRYKAVVWTAAAIIPAYTAALRVAAGKHFYTDVIAGYGYGALCGIIVPYVFSSKRKYNNKLTIYPAQTLGGTGLGLVYQL